MIKDSDKQQGFTLIELMVTVAMVTILLTVGIPSFSELIRNNGLVSQTNAFTTDLGVARSEAINRSVQVTICKSADGAACTTSGNWEQGWILFEDNNGDGDVDAGDDLIRVHDSLPTGYTLRADGTVFDDWIAYLPTGFGVGNGGTFDGKSFRVCTSEAAPAKARAIQISTTGRARLAVGSSVTGFTCP